MSGRDPKSLSLASGLWSLPALKLVKAWKDCAGPALLRQTRFLGVLQEGSEWVLRLEVPDPMWRQELDFQKEQILASFRQALSKLGYPESRMPTRCLLAQGRALPVQTRLPKK